MKKLKFPTAQTILLIIAVLVAVLTWIIPAGKYDSLAYDNTNNTFTRITQEKTLTLPATQETLNNLNVKIPLEKFTSGDIWKPISIPKTYKELQAKPQGVVALLKAPIKGIIEASDIIFLVLFIGGLIGIMNATGAFEAGIAWLAKTLKGREYWLIISVTFLISLGGTTFGLAEETIAFYPILIPIFLASKYDAMVPLASIFLGSSVGTMCATTNPFSTIIASDTAGIIWTSGLNSRLLIYALCTTICIVYIMRYAKRVKNDPTKSVIYDERDKIESLFGNITHSHLKLNTRLRVILFVFIMCFVVMVIGVSRLKWWFLEMTVVFFVGTIIIGLMAKLREDKLIDTFVKGAGDLLGVALIIGIARGVTILMEDGLISDTLLYYSSHVTSGMNKGLFINVMFYIYAGLSFFIPSSSGMAVLTMPIMAPLADSVGLGREMIVNAYNYGMGLFAFINPTSLILATLAIVKVGFDKWLKFVMPLVFILLIFLMIVLTISVYV